MTSINEDLGDLCLECRKDTSFGSGKFINRIPCSRADNCFKTEEGYLCEDCYTQLLLFDISGK